MFPLGTLLEPMQIYNHRIQNVKHTQERKGMTSKEKLFWGDTTTEVVRVIALQEKYTNFSDFAASA